MFSNNINYGVSGSAPLISTMPSFAPGIGASNPQAAAIQQQAQSPLDISPLGQTAGAAGAGGTLGTGGSGFGLNLPTAQLALGGLQTIGSIWNAWESQKLAKKQFAYTKDVTEANMRNQIQAFNTTLGDRSRSRAHIEGQSPEQAQAYVDANRLHR